MAWSHVADIHDFQVFESLLGDDEDFVRTDKAYESKKRYQRLKEAGIEDRLLYKAKPKRKQLRWQIELNKPYSTVRSCTERIFEYLK